MTTNSPVITLTIIGGPSPLAHMIGTTAWSLSSQIEGCQANYYTLRQWAALCSQHKEWTHIAKAVFYDGGNDEDYKTLLAEQPDFDFLLLDERGKPVCRRIAGELCVLRTSFATAHGPSVRMWDAATRFTQEFFNSTPTLVAPIYWRPNSLDGFAPDFQIITDDLLSYLAKHPEHLNKLHHRKFEELLASIFGNLGYEVILGPGVGDGGVDLRLIARGDIGELVLLVQAKRYAPHRRIPLAPVQALYGAVEAEEASKGLFITTSDFEPVAKRFAAQHPRRVALAGPREIQQWLMRCMTYIQNRR